MTNTTTTLWNNRFFVIAAVQQNGLFLQKAQKVFQDDEEIVSVAIKQQPEAIQYALPRVIKKLNIDLDSLIQFPKRRGRKIFDDAYDEKAWHVINGRLHNVDRDTVLSRIKRSSDGANSYIINNYFGNNKNIDDKELILAAVEIFPFALDSASERLRKDKEVALAAIKVDSTMIRLVHADLKYDLSFALEAIVQNPIVLMNSYKNLTKDRNTLLMILERNGLGLEYAPRKFKQDLEICLTAVMNNPLAISCVDKSVANQPAFITEVINFYHAKYIKDKRIEQNLFTSAAITDKKLSKISDITIVTTGGNLTENQSFSQPAPIDMFRNFFLFDPANNATQHPMTCANRPILTPSSGMQFYQHAVISDGDCGYTAFGITRSDAYQLLSRNVNKVRTLLQPAIKEALLTESFIDYLKNQEQATAGLLTAFRQYQEAARQAGNTDTAITQLYRYGDDLFILQAYLAYDIQDKRIDAGWSHPAILQALAEAQGIELYIWQAGDRQQLLPHAYYAHHNPSQASGRVDLLFINGNHFERLQRLDLTMQTGMSHEFGMETIELGSADTHSNPLKRKAQDDMAEQLAAKRPRLDGEQPLSESQDLLQLASLDIPMEVLDVLFGQPSQTGQVAKRIVRVGKTQFNPVDAKNVQLTLSRSTGERTTAQPSRQTTPQTRPVQTSDANATVIENGEILTSETMNHIGRWGEEVIYRHWFKQRYYEKYRDYSKTKTDKGFILSKDNLTVEVQWHNKNLPLTQYTTHDHDIAVIKRNNQGEILKHQYIEVKTTRSPTDITLNFSPNEVKLMRQCKHEQKDSLNKYRLFKVFNAGEKEVRFEKERNPYQRAKEEAGFVLRDKAATHLDM
ncbi:MAG: hypothetical protein K0S11_376 [Gammaproteobacteria bacterium]|jgi:hypothetical protein|nr:hypothetical protein [Gammaproteobacteria bacterium]